MSKTMVTVGGAIAVVAAAMVVKLHYFPVVKDAYFKPDFDNLRTVPAGIVALRPTHTKVSIGDPIRNSEEGSALLRAVGRGVTFRNLIAEAYDCEPGRVVLPADAPKGSFDFLVTASGDVRKRLQTAIRKQLGYSAQHEMRTVDVLKLKVTGANPPGIAVSPEGEDETIQYKDGKLYFKHKTLDLLLAGLEDGLAEPVLDETGLTGRYNYSIVWSQDIEKAMRQGGFNLDGVQKVLASLGLRLEPDTAMLDMVVVNKGR